MMNPRIKASLAALVATVIAVKLPALGIPIEENTAVSIAGAIVSFLAGLLLPAPSASTKVD